MVLVVLAALGVLVAAACEGSDDKIVDPEMGETEGTDLGEDGAPAGDLGEDELPPLGGPVDVIVDGDPQVCDPLDPRHCLLPFPSDFHTVDDAALPTGRRLAFDVAAMPANADGVHIDPGAWRAADGFSPGSAILFWLEDVDLERSGAAPLTDLGRSLDASAPIVLLDTDTGELVPHWAEIDSTQPEPNLVIVRPAVNFADGHRIVVGVRGMVDRRGDALAPSDAFHAYRDRLDTGNPVLEAQRDRYERVFADLEGAGVRRSDLQLAWDFTVGSAEQRTRDMLQIRDDAFDRLGERAPRFRVLESQPSDHAGVARIVAGTFTMPNYLDGTGAAGERFLRDAETGLPVRNPKTPTFEAAFRCAVPESAVAGADPEPARAVVYGHGLLGSEGEVASGAQQAMAARFNMAYCATKWYGFSAEDVPVAVASLQDLSNFPRMVERSQQGILAQLWLARLMRHPGGLVSDPAFQADDGTGAPAIDTSDVFFDGNSQGGIMGGAATAVSTEWTRAVLGVPGMNYSTLLRRSIDWDAYRAIYDPAYPDELERTIGINLAQILWDRIEANGYAHRMTTDPLPGTPEHTVLLHVAFGDQQVSPYTADVEARTIGARIHWPAVAEGRLPDVEPYWGIERIDRYPYDGSAIVIWDSGAAAVPIGNVAPREGRDPHEDPRRDPAAQRQKSAFLRTGGVVIDVCGGAPCTAAPAD
jgi:hypothetical protein